MLRLLAVACLFSSAVACAEDRAVKSITTAPAVSEAPGRGIKPVVHTAALATLFDLDQVPAEQVTPLIQRQFISGAQSTITKWTIKAGGVFPLHHHPYEQTTWITKGRCDVYSQGKKYVLNAGMLIIFPPNVPHELVCLEDSIDMDFFAPQRQDWMDGIPSAAAMAK